MAHPPPPPLKVYKTISLIRWQFLWSCWFGNCNWRCFFMSCIFLASLWPSLDACCLTAVTPRSLQDFILVFPLYSSHQLQLKKNWLGNFYENLYLFLKKEGRQHPYIVKLFEIIRKIYGKHQRNQIKKQLKNFVSRLSKKNLIQLE